MVDLILKQNRARREIQVVEQAQGQSDLDTRAIDFLLIVLSVVSGSTDTIGFLDLNGLFTAHITGNLVVLAAHIVQGGDASLAKILAVPVFIIVLDLTILLVAGLRAINREPLLPLLLLQCLLLICFLILCVAIGPGLGSQSPLAVVASMVGVSAMAVQNALVQASLKGAPSTAVMTTNIVRFATDLGELLLKSDPVNTAAARKRAARTLPVILGFVVGCILGAVTEKIFGVRSLALPAVFALLAFVIAFAIPSDRGRR